MTLQTDGSIHGSCVYKIFYSGKYAGKAFNELSSAVRLGLVVTALELATQRYIEYLL